MTKQKITTFLTFNDQAEEAVTLYTSVFPRSKVTSVTRLPGASPGAEGRWLTATFELDGQSFYALNGGPTFTFTQGISLFVSCETQPEIDELWAKLTAGGKEVQCGWLVDRFGVSWQIVPSLLGRYLSDPDPAKAGRVMQAMMKMVKLDIAALQRAYDNG